MGNRTKRIDNLGRTTEYEYDALNRLSKIKYLLSAENLVTALSTTYNYDELSRLTSAINEAGTVSLTYDNRSRLKTETDIFGHVIEYGYDANSNRVLLKLDGASDATYTYDDSNRLKTIINVDDNTTTTYDYDFANRLTSRLLPNGITTTYNYDGMSRLTRLKDATAAATIFDRQYSYDNASRINQIAESTGTRTFGYDDVNRLTSATDSILGNEAYELDAVGNRTSSHRSATYSYQPFNRVVATASTSMMYDANGNMTQKSEGKDLWRYTWDYENRMVEARTRKERVRYRYDALGRRVERVLGYGKERTRFTHDGVDVLLDDDSGTLTRYTNGPGLDSKLRAKVGSTANYFLGDHLGSTTALTDSTGLVAQQAHYDAFGNQSAVIGTRYSFTGRELDRFTGLLYYRARFYDPNLGRFVSEDPVGLVGGTNSYSYVRNMPLAATDALGLIPDGPTNALRDPLSPEHWVANGISNTISDLLGLDNVAKWSWRIGDYRCSGADRILAAGKLTFHAASTVAAGAVTARAATSVAGIARVESLAHLTNAEAAAAIDSSGVLAGSGGAPGGIYATPISNAGSGVRTAITTGIAPGNYQAAIPITRGAEGAFGGVAPIGPVTAWQYLSGTHYTARGALNLTTGNFARSGININQAIAYGADSVITPGIAAITRGREAGCGCR